MTKATKCPPLGTGSVDFSALHAADAKGADLKEALEAATTRMEPIPELTGRESLADLTALAEIHSIEATDGWEKKDFLEALEAKRNTPPPASALDVVVDDDGAPVAEPEPVPASAPDTAGDAA